MIIGYTTGVFDLFHIGHLNIIKQSNIEVLSSNYPLYADISNRTMTLLSSFSNKQEVYSIDECFLDFSGNRETLAIGQKIKKRLRQFLVRLWVKHAIWMPHFVWKK